VAQARREGPVAARPFGLDVGVEAFDGVGFLAAQLALYAEGWRDEVLVAVSLVGAAVESTPTVVVSLPPAASRTAM
jgi:hypothetical protein